MHVENIEFAKLEKDLAETDKSVMDYLAPNIGKVYVIAITRENCPACRKQKPRLDRLAATVKQGYRDKVVFIRIHVKRPPTSEEESLRSKNMFGHYFYPTNLILLKTRDRGTIEYYRNTSLTMSELRRNIESAVETAAMMKNEKE
jgi:thiol-disulfide isomerase/thioredoxin